MAPSCSNCRRLRPHKKSRRVAKAAFEFRRCRAQDGVPKRPAAPFAKRRGPIFGDNFRAVAQHCLPCNSGARRLHNGSPHREARTILPRSHHCQYRAIPVCFLAADLISAWPAPIRQPTPTPPKVAPANFAADQSSPPTTSSTPLRGRGRRAIVRPDSQGQRFEPPPERRTFKSERPAAIPIRQIAWNGRTIRHKSKNR